MSSEETIKKLIKKDHPKLSDDEIDKIAEHLSKLADLLFEEWLEFRRSRPITKDNQQ